VTIIVSVKINDGVVMASDSASTFGNNQIYLNADKIVNLVKGLPIGVMVTGNGGIGAESIATLLKDLRARLDGSANHPWMLKPSTYTIEGVANRIHDFLFSEKVAAFGQDVWMKLRICGYSAGRPLPEIWEVVIVGQQSQSPTLVQKEDDFGVRWDGEMEALNRLLIGFASLTPELWKELGVDEHDTRRQSEIYRKISADVGALLALPAMPVQDAIDLARYLVEVTTGFVRFNIGHQPKTVGGVIEIAAITKHEGFKWVQRKHFYPTALNP